MTMKTPEQWNEHFGIRLLNNVVESIQADARADVESERDQALAANKLLVEALEKIEKCSWHGYNTYDLGAMAREAIVSVNQP